MEPTVEELRRNYEKFDDDKITRIATREAAGLRPEALELLKSIIKERGISDDVLRSIEAQTQEIDDAVVNEYTVILRSLPCPICGLNMHKLNATLRGEVISIILITKYHKQLKIACPDCLDKENYNGLKKTLLLGWWALPWGIIRTMQSVFLNLKMKKQNRNEEPNDLLISFVLENIGLIETARHSPDELKEIIQHT